LGSALAPVPPDIGAIKLFVAGDNPAGNDPDAFPTDPTQWDDTDGDG